MQSFFLGIDVSKGYADFVVINDQKQTVLKNFQLDDTHAGHKRLLHIIETLLKQHPQARLFAAVEGTGGYENNVASSADPVTKQLVGATTTQILGLKKTIDAQQKLMVAQCTIAEVELLTTFTGISNISAIGLMLEIQDVKRFKSAKKLASHFGLHPVYKTSGDGKSGFKMSKQGRKEPRRILFMVALSAIRCNPVIRDVPVLYYNYLYIELIRSKNLSATHSVFSKKIIKKFA